MTIVAEQRRLRRKWLQFASSVAMALLVTTTASTQAWSRDAARSAQQQSFDETFAHHRTYVGDVRLHYVRGGRGTPLVLVHGWPATWYEWHRIMPALAEHHDVIAVDLRGLGDSSRPESGYDATTAARDIAGLIQQLGLKKVDMAGHDIGGQIAFAFARDHGDMLQRLVILDIAIPGLAEWDTSQPWHFAFQGTRDVPEALVAGREAEYLSYFYRGEAYDPAAIRSEDASEYLRTYTQPGALRTGFGYYRSFKHDAEVNRRWVAAGGKLSMPVLWLGGTSASNQPADGGSEPAATAGLLGRQLAGVSSDLRGEAIERCGHWLAEECPAVIIQKMRGFFVSTATTIPGKTR